MTASEGWSVCETRRRCYGCNTAFAEGGRYYAALFFAPPAVERRDFCPRCWAGLSREEALAYWCFRAPAPPRAAPDRTAPTLAQCLAFLREGGEGAPLPRGLPGLLVLLLARRRKLRLVAVSPERLRYRFPDEEEVREVEAPGVDPEALARAEAVLWDLLDAGEHGSPPSTRA